MQLGHAYYHEDMRDAHPDQEHDVVCVDTPSLIRYLVTQLGGLCCCMQDASQDEIDAEEQRLLLLALQSSMGIFSTLP